MSFNCSKRVVQIAVNGARCVPRPLVSGRITAVRHQSQFKRINAKINRIGDESTKESQVVLKLVRKAGLVSVVVVICSLLWNSSFVDAPQDTLPVQEIQDLTVDVRNSNK